MARRAPRPEDFLVEYRDKTLERKGVVPSQDLQLKYQPVFNGVGSWSLTLPAEHRAVPFLRAPGAGIIITNLITGQVELSGSTSKPSKKATSSDNKGLVTIAGLSDDRLLWDALAYPQPTNADVTTQTVANDVRSGAAESIMRQYVAYNIANGAIRREGPTSWAPAGRLAGFRELLRLEANPATPIGPTLTKRPRFQVLGDLLNEIALEAGGIGFRIVQIDGYLEFQVYEPSDMTAEIRLDVANGTLQEQSVETAPPDVTRVIVAGQGEGTERQFLQVTTDEATTAEDDWGFVIEEFKDQRQTDVEDELLSAAMGDLNDRGFTKVAVKAVPANDQTMVFMQDFFLGDKIGIVIEEQETHSNITEAAITVDNSGVHTAVAIGDIADFDRESALRGQVQDNTKRISDLETNIEPTPARLQATGGQISDWNDATDAGFYWGDSAAHEPSMGGSWKAGWVVPGHNGITAQIVLRPDSMTDGVQMRVLPSSGAWSDWKPLPIDAKSLISGQVDVARIPTINRNSDGLRAYFGVDDSPTAAGGAYLGIAKKDFSTDYVAWITQNNTQLYQFSELTKTGTTFIDTDYVTSGLSFGLSSGWAVSQYALRNKHGMMSGAMELAYSGVTLTADSNGNFGDTNIFQLPSGWRPTNKFSEYFVAQRAGYTGYNCRMEAGNGQVVLTGGSYPGQTLTSGMTINFPMRGFCLD